MDIYLGTRRVLAVNADDAQTLLMNQAVSGFEEALAVLHEQLLDEKADQLDRKTKARIWLSGGLARPFMLNAPARVSQVELQRIAEAMAPEQTGLQGPCAVWVERVNKASQAGGSNKGMAVAIEADKLQALLSRFEKRNRNKSLRLQTIRPWWAEVLRASLQGSEQLQALAVQDCDSLVILSGKERQFETVQTLSPVTDVQTAQAALMRRLLSIDVNAEAVRRVRLRADAAADQDAGWDQKNTAGAIKPMAMALMQFAEITA